MRRETKFGFILKLPHGRNAVKTPCNHKFGRECLEERLKKRGRCPTCNRDLGFELNWREIGHSLDAQHNAVPVGDSDTQVHALFALKITESDEELTRNRKPASCRILQMQNLICRESGPMRRYFKDATCSNSIIHLEMAAVVLRVIAAYNDEIAVACNFSTEYTFSIELLKRLLPVARRGQLLMLEKASGFIAVLSKADDSAIRSSLEKFASQYRLPLSFCAALGFDGEMTAGGICLGPGLAPIDLFRCIPELVLHMMDYLTATEVAMFSSAYNYELNVEQKRRLMNPLRDLEQLPQTATLLRAGYEILIIGPGCRMLMERIATPSIYCKKYGRRAKVEVVLVCFLRDPHDPDPVQDLGLDDFDGQDLIVPRNLTLLANGKLEPGATVWQPGWRIINTIDSTSGGDYTHDYADIEVMQSRVVHPRLISMKLTTNGMCRTSSGAMADAYPHGRLSNSRYMQGYINYRDNCKARFKKFLFGAVDWNLELLFINTLADPFTIVKAPTTSFKSQDNPYNRSENFNWIRGGRLRLRPRDSLILSYGFTGRVTDPCSFEIPYYEIDFQYISKEPLSRVVHPRIVPKAEVQVDHTKMEDDFDLSQTEGVTDYGIGYIP
jgi:hypothetical protein